MVVLDAVRWDTFQRVFGQPPLPRERFGALTDLRNEAVRFDHTASVAPWTLPAHASLFTGLYPWKHGTHGRGALELAGDHPVLAELLRSAGYRTLCLSANAFLGPESGFGRGFDRSLVASWRAPFFRWSSLERGGEAGGEVHPQRSGNGQSIAGPATSQLELQILTRFPFLLDIWNRGARKLRPEEFDSSSLSVSPWVESSFHPWVAALEPDKPFFAFVNLLDAHGPYLTDTNQALSVREWWRLMRVDQAQAHYILHPGEFTSADQRALLTLYEQTVVNLATRVGRLVASLQACGRWNNTLFLLTSDHGQSFGEHGWLFHGSRVDEPLIRIPLWARFPFARHSGDSPQVWASLVDIAPTVLGAAGMAKQPDLEGVSLEMLLDRSSRGPILAATDGLADRVHASQWLPTERFRELDRVRVAAYSGNRKLILVQGESEPRAFDPASDPAEAHDLWEGERVSLAPLRLAAEETLAAMLSSETKTVPHTVRERLASWGYV